MDACLGQIIEWSMIRPAWQQDALRRLIEKDTLDKEDISELTQMCKVVHGLTTNPADAHPEPKAFPSDQAEKLNTTQKPVSLLSIASPQNVNALSADSGLSVSPNGLTVVYGDNGSGKSGYTRILRQLCRARGGSQDILTNVFGSHPDAVPSATITYCSDNTDESIDWVSGVQAATPLNQINIFDSSSARHLIASENEATYRPFGLDLLDSLADTLVAVKATLDSERDSLPEATDFGELAGDTAVGKLISELSSKTETDLVTQLAALTNEEKKRHQWLKENIPQMERENPIKRAQEMRSKSARFSSFAQRLEGYANTFGADANASLKALQTASDTARETADVASRKLFSEQPLNGVGDALWLSLWRAAKAFSEEVAYPKQDFPQTGQDKRCVLCQQELQPDAAGRLKAFSDFVAGELQQEATNRQTEFTTAAQPISSFQFQEELDAAAIAEIIAVDEALSKEADAYVKSAIAIKAELLAAIADSSKWVELQVLPAPCSGRIREYAESLKRSADEYEKAGGPEGLDALKAELAELDAREKLSAFKSAVLKEVERLKLLDILAECSRDTNTRGITAISNRLTDELVTSVLCDSFLTELRKLGMHTALIALQKARSERGVVYHRLVFQHNEDASLEAVLSEGEHRCIALAAFLSELATSPSKSGIVFDDPVSSLDHLWRDRTARRLVAEAKERQVIVFTHDLVFLMMLGEHAGRMSVSVTDHHLTRTGTSVGVCQDGPPWYGMKTSQRLGKLKAQQQELVAFHRTATEEDYEPKARRLYGLLRETWERAIEEVVLNGVVTRFAKGVKTQSLRAVTDLTEEDYQAVDAGMSKCSGLLDGHDDASAMGNRLPNPDEIKEDIIVLETFIKNIRNRRR